MTEIVLRIEGSEEARLRARAEQLGLTETDLIHRAIEDMLANERAQVEVRQDRLRARRAAVWAQERVWREQWIARPDRQPMEPWSRQELYEERLSRYDRQRDG